MIYTGEHFFNRELSWLEFNQRVLEEAEDKSNPLLERLKFLAIASSNLDEFFMIRVAGLKEQIEFGYKKKDISGISPKNQLKLIRERVVEFVAEQYSYLNRSLMPKLEKEGIFFVDYVDLSDEQKKFITEYFKENIFPILTPMAIDSGRPFPLLLNKSLNLVVKLQNEEKEELFSVVQVPSILSRFIQVPSEKGNKFILLEEVIKGNIECMFEGYKIKEVSYFRITRDSDMNIEEDEAEDLLKEIENSLKMRKWGVPVRLEIKNDMDNSLKKFLMGVLDVGEERIYNINGPIDLTFLMKFYGIEGYEKLRFEKNYPNKSVEFFGEKSMFDVIRKKDVVLHHPYETFDHVVEFVKEAAEDPKVLAIKQTLYRVSGSSPIVNSLIKAVENGKQVTVLIELKARFDEERNINWAKKLEKAGCHVVYGLAGLKTHAKVLLVVRRDEDGIRRYLHLGTGNYNDSTAKIYTDIGFFTSKESYCSDASNMFNILTGFSKPLMWKKLSLAPFAMRGEFYRLIKSEIESVKEGKNGRIIFKMNSLVDKEMIEALYEAAQSGVKIDLIVRGMCCLKSCMEGISENIRVISIVGRYLEHSRIYYFENGGNPKIYLSSADLMERNLDWRIETLFPIEEQEIKEKIKKILELNIEDCIKSRVQNVNGKYERIDKRGKKNINAQEIFYNSAKESYLKIVEDEKQKVIKI